MTGGDGRGRPGRDGDHVRRVVRALAGLLAALERDDHTYSGRRSSGRCTVDYSLSVRSLSDALGRGPSADHIPALTSRETADGVVVVADLPDAGERDIDVSFDRLMGVLAVNAGGVALGRVPLADGDRSVADVSVNNGVLEVTLRDE